MEAIYRFYTEQERADWLRKKGYKKPNGILVNVNIFEDENEKPFIVECIVMEQYFPRDNYLTRY